MSRLSPSQAAFAGALAGAVAGYQLALWAAPQGGLLRALNRKVAAMTGAAPAARATPKAPPATSASGASLSEADSARAGPASDAAGELPPKMVIVLRRDVDMGRGKAAAQAAHAAVATFKRARRADPALVRDWEKRGASAKVVVRAESEAEVEALAAAAAAAGLPSKTIADAGRTQVAPGTVTALAVLGSAAAVNAVTGGLKLF